MAVISANRNPSSHLAGGTVLNAGDDSIRYSRDFDIFHDAEQEVIAASDRDCESLVNAGFTVERRRNWNSAEGFRQAHVTREDSSVEIDWAVDTVIRFFPVEQDAILGWRLHPFDAAVNKALALASRSETRDYLDIVQLRTLYPLPALCWAACGKDTGFTPILLLEMMRRFARIDPIELNRIQAREVDPIQLKKHWIEMTAYAESELVRVADKHPDIPIGLAFVNSEGQPRWLDSEEELTNHPAQPGGCIPRIS